MAPDAPQIWPAATGNIVAQMSMAMPRRPRQPSGQAAHVVSLDLVNQRLAPTPMEPRSVLASYDAASDRLTLRLSTQMPSGARDSLAELLGIPPKEIRVVVGDVGGGFGMKTGLYPEDIVAAFAARQLQRPVKWTAERIEEFLAATHGRESRAKPSSLSTPKARCWPIACARSANMGAYAGTVGIVIQLLIGPWVVTSIYDIKTIDFDFNAVLTNTAPTSPPIAAPAGRKRST